MNKILCSLFVFVSTFAIAQSKTTEILQKKFNDSFSLFFYHNTLRMINQSESKEFDEMIKDIEKMKFLMIDKREIFKPVDYQKLKKDYLAETFEEVMTTRYQGRNLDILMKEKSGRTLGMVVLVNDSTSLYVLDIVGRITPDKVATLYRAIDESADIRNKTKNFSGRNAKRRDSDKEGNH
jgi:hypothetical protein